MRTSKGGRGEFTRVTGGKFAVITKHQVIVYNNQS